MIRIQLTRGEWQYDATSPLGPPGGFGAVFAGKGETHEPVAVKRLHPGIISAAHRELRMADVLMQRSLRHVIPVFDAGQDSTSGSYFIVMPQAEKSLQQEIDRISVFTEEEAVDILRQIALGLMEVNEIVHRDLKPGNVLFHEGKWKVADFGIARFVEESTSLQTLRDCLSPPYAAPEQWRMERATSATDVYSLGCIAYELLTGEPPFRGPEAADYREQHLHVEPETLNEISPRLRGLVAAMLRKNPQSRPGIERIIAVLESIGRATGHRDRSGFQALARAGASAMEKVARAEAALEQDQAREVARSDFARGAFESLHQAVDSLFSRICEAAPAATPAGSWDEHHRVWIKLGRASLQVSLLYHGRPVPEGTFSHSGWNVIAGAKIHVHQEEPETYMWSANLWFTDAGRGDDYRWWEIAYYTALPADRRRISIYEPYAVDEAQIGDADLAASRVVHAIAMAYEPVPIDGEDFDDFCDRWAGLLADAFEGKLRSPGHLPLS